MSHESVPAQNMQNMDTTLDTIPENGMNNYEMLNQQNAEVNSAAVHEVHNEAKIETHLRNEAPDAAEPESVMDIDSAVTEHTANANTIDSNASAPLNSTSHQTTSAAAAQNDTTPTTTTSTVPHSVPQQQQHSTPQQHLLNDSTHSAASSLISNDDDNMDLEDDSQEISPSKSQSKSPSRSPRKRSPKRSAKSTPSKSKPSAINTKLKDQLDSNFSPLTPASGTPLRIPPALDSGVTQDFKDTHLLDPVYDGIEMGVPLKSHQGHYRVLSKDIEVYHGPFAFAYDQLRSVERGGHISAMGGKSIFELQENLSTEEVKSKLRSMWEVAYICYVCKVMRPLLKFMHFDPDHLERAFLNPEVEENSDLLADIHIRLAKGPVIDKRSREILLEPELEQWVSILRNKLDYLQQNFPESAIWTVNPLKSCSYTRLSPFLRVLLLKALCDWKLLTKTQRFIDLLKKMDDANELRMQPLAYDNDGNIFWYFGPEVGRLYLERPPVKQANGQLQKSTWELVCDSVEGFRQFLAEHTNSQDDGIRRIMDNIERFIIQDILSYQGEKEKKRKEREHKIEEKLRMRQQALHEQDHYVETVQVVEEPLVDSSEELKKKQLKMARAERQKARENQKKLLELQEQTRLYAQTFGSQPFGIPRSADRLGSFRTMVGVGMPMAGAMGGMGGFPGMGSPPVHDAPPPPRAAPAAAATAAYDDDDDDGRPKKKRKKNDDDEFVPDDLGDEDDEIFQQEMELQEEKERKRLARKGIFQKSPPPTEVGGFSSTPGGIVNFTSPQRYPQQQQIAQFQQQRSPFAAQQFQQAQFQNNKRPFNPHQQFSPFAFGQQQQPQQQQAMGRFAPQGGAMGGNTGGVPNAALGNMGMQNNFGARLPMHQQQNSQQQNAGLLNQVNLIMNQMMQQGAVQSSPPQHAFPHAQQQQQMYHQSPPQQQPQQHQRQSVDPYMTTAAQQQNNTLNRQMQQNATNAFVQSSPHQFPQSNAGSGSGGMYRNDQATANQMMQQNAAQMDVQSRNDYLQKLLQQQQSQNPGMHQLNTQQQAQQMNPSQLQQLQQMQLMRQMQQQQQQHATNQSPPSGMFPFQQQAQQQSQQQLLQQQKLHEMQLRLQQQQQPRVQHPVVGATGHMNQMGGVASTQQQSQQQHMNPMGMNNFGVYPGFGQQTANALNQNQQNKQQSSQSQDFDLFNNFGSF